MAENRNIAEIRPILTPYVFFLGFLWRDHAFVRYLIPNFYAVDDQLFRSGHPSPRRLRIARRRGIASILSLRGGADNTPNYIERVAAADLGLELRFIRMRTVELPQADVLLELLDLLRDMPKPMLVHCKSGSDRTGLAVMLYQHVIKDIPLAEARRALSWRFGHWRFGKAGVVHRLLDTYAAAQAETGISFEDWVRTDYDPAALMAAHRSGRV